MVCALSQLQLLTCRQKMGLLPAWHSMSSSCGCSTFVSSVLRSWQPTSRRCTMLHFATAISHREMRCLEVRSEPNHASACDASNVVHSFDLEHTPGW